MRRLWRNYNLTIVAGVLFLATFAAFAAIEWSDYEHEAERHGEKAAFGSFLTRLGAFTLENWQSEFLHIFVFVLMTAFLVHKGSAESRDSDDRIEETLERIEQRLDRLDGEQGGVSSAPIGDARPQGTDAPPSVGEPPSSSAASSEPGTRSSADPPAAGAPKARGRPPQRMDELLSEDAKPFVRPLVVAAVAIALVVAAVVIVIALSL